LRSTIPFIWPLTCSIVTPGLSRAIIELDSLPRMLSLICSGVNENGMSIETPTEGTSKSAGSTPVTRYGSPLSRISRPTIDGSAPKCVVHMP
jgi:hypothetical protein